MGFRKNIFLFCLIWVSALFAEIDLRSLNLEMLERAKSSHVNVIHSFDEECFVDFSCSFFHLMVPKKRIGKGTHSEVFLCADSEDCLYAVKKYSLDETVSSLMKEHKVDPKEWLIRLVQDEFEAGLRLSHPHIVKIHNVVFRDSEAYVVMDFIEGHPFDPFKQCDFRKRLLVQFLDTLDYILAQEMVPDDLWSENLLVDEDEQKLVFIDLGGFERIDDSRDVCFHEYLNQFYHVIDEFIFQTDVPEFQWTLAEWKNRVFSEIDPDVPLSKDHLLLFRAWIAGLKLSLGERMKLGSNTVHLSSFDELFSLYQNHTRRFPEHISFVTGQSEKFLFYELIARSVFQKCHPDKECEHVCLLRYPTKDSPKDLQELFARFPIREDYDTVSAKVADFLVAASPDLSVDEEDESAIAIFRKNDRDQEFEDFIFQIFKEEGIPRELYEERIQDLIEEAPLSKKGGILMQIFLPKRFPMSKVMYLSLPYGIPYEERSDFIPQVRFLPSAVWHEHGSQDVRMLCYTFLSPKRLSDFALKVDSVIQEIFKEYKERTLELGRELLMQGERDDCLESLSLTYLERFDPLSSLKCVEMMSGDRKDHCLVRVIAGLLECQKYQEVKRIVLEKGLEFPERIKCLAHLALNEIEQRNLWELKRILELLPESPQKNFVLLISLLQFPEEREYFSKQLSSSFSRDLEELGNERVLEFGFE